MLGLETADEVVMAIDVHVVVDFHEPGTPARAAGHVAGDGDHRASPVLPARAGTLAGLSGLAIEWVRGGIAIGGERLIDRLIICPTGATDHVGQVTLIIGSNNEHAKVMMKIIWPTVYPV